MRFLRSNGRRALTLLVPFAWIVACGVDAPGMDVGAEAEGGAVEPSADGAAGDSASSDAASAIDASPDGSPDGSAACGGDGGTPCAVGAACAADADCEGKCTAAKVCAAPTHDDGEVSPSLGETDVDCGGATAPRCAEARTCKVDGDCTTTACSAGKTCVAPSCRGGANGTSGITTCGAGEAASDSCCRTLPLPVRTTRSLDKYEITSGRVRAFIDAVSAANGGVPNVRAFAVAYAAAHPNSQLASVVANYPGLIDVLPDHAGPNGQVPLPYHLGAAPLDPMNALDGCFVGPDAYGHASYWQPPTDLAPLGVGYPGADGAPDGVRKISRAELDKKSMNCVMPIMLASFCAWDGGELARTDDFREVWGRNPVSMPRPTGAPLTVYIPWTAMLSIGEYNFRNGHGAACNPLFPGCTNPQLNFYAYPLPFNPADDDAAAIGAPGRFPKDLTAITSANGEGWFDVGGNLMEAAWPNGNLNTGANPILDFCDTANGVPGPGETACTRRDKPGVLRFSGALPHAALIGYSFEAHQRRSEAYLASLDGAESRIAAGDSKPITFQYGKVGGRCARPAP